MNRAGLEQASDGGASTDTASAPHCVAVVTTVGTRDEARRIGQGLVERRLAACAQISEIESWYRWDGAVQHAPEFRLLLKTTADRVEAVERAVLELHSYAMPAIHAEPLLHVHPPYAAWIEVGSNGDETGSDGPA